MQLDNNITYTEKQLQNNNFEYSIINKSIMLTSFNP